MTKKVPDAGCVTVNGNGVLRVDEIAVMQLVVYDDDGSAAIWLRVGDGNRQRCSVRGDKYVAVPLDLFLAKVLKFAQRKLTRG